MGWSWMFAGVLIGLAVGSGTSLYLFTRSSIQPGDLVFLGTFLGLLSGINFGFRLGFSSGLRLDAAWGGRLGLLIGGLAAFTCGYREALAGSPEGSPRTCLLAFGLATGQPIGLCCLTGRRSHHLRGNLPGWQPEGDDPNFYLLTMARFWYAPPVNAFTAWFPLLGK